MYGRFNKNSVSSSNTGGTFSAIRKVSTIDFRSNTEQKPSLYIYANNETEIYYSDSSNNVKILNIETGAIRSIGKTLNSGAIKVSNNYVIVANRYIYSKNTFNLLADIGAHSILDVNYDDNIYITDYDSSTTTISLYKLEKDFTLTLMCSIVKSVSSLKKVVVVDNILKIVYAYNSYLWYAEYDISTTSSTVDVQVLSTSGDSSIVKSGNNLYISRQRDTSYQYTYLQNSGNEMTLLSGYCLAIKEYTPFVSYSTTTTDRYAFIFINNEYDMPNALKTNFRVSGIAGRVLASDVSDVITFYTF